MTLKKVFTIALLTAGSLNTLNGCITFVGECISTGGPGGDVELCINEKLGMPENQEDEGFFEDEELFEDDYGFSIQDVFANGQPDNTLLEALEEDNDYVLFLELQKNKSGE